MIDVLRIRSHVTAVDTATPCTSRGAWPQQPVGLVTALAFDGLTRCRRGTYTATAACTRPEVAAAADVLPPKTAQFGFVRPGTGSTIEW